jgi:signal transduction histidine kinase
VDLSQLVRDIADLYRPLAEEKEISLVENIAEGRRITGHQQFLSQAVANLLDNAVKFSPQGGEIRIALTGDSGGDPGAASLVICDAGPGIAAAEHERVLKRFHRLDENAAAGSGLGLSLVAGVAKLHGAELQLGDSQLGGLSVRLTFAAAASERRITKN